MLKHPKQVQADNFERNKVFVGFGCHRRKRVYFKDGQKEFPQSFYRLIWAEQEVLTYSQWKAAEATVKLNATNTMGEDVTMPLVIAYYAQSGELFGYSKH